MNTTRSNRPWRFFIDIVAIAAVLFSVAVFAQDEPVANAKQSFSSGGFASGARDSGVTPGVDAAVQSKQRNDVSRTISSDFDIYEAFVDIYYDDDHDGHYYGLNVEFDADTVYASAEVYALLYLSFEGGPWELYYTTDYFTINGSSPIDDYQVETELFSGYPTGYYDVLVELYDGFDDTLVAEIGPAQTSALSDLPLEDQQKDTPDFVIVGPVSHSHGGGGAAGALSLLALAGVAAWRRRRSTHAAGVR